MHDQELKLREELGPFLKKMSKLPRNLVGKYDQYDDDLMELCDSLDKLKVDEDSAG